MHAIAKRFPTVISFPNDDDLLKVIQGYEATWGFPMCAGAIDGTHIPILAPCENHLEYVQGCSYWLAPILAPSENRYLFRDVVIGWPVSLHDARVLSNSTIFERANKNCLFTCDLSEAIIYNHFSHNVSTLKQNKIEFRHNVCS